MLLREMNESPSLQLVPDSSGTQSVSTIRRELNIFYLLKASTKPTHYASCCQHQPSDLTEILCNSAIRSTMTQDDKARECEMMYDLTLMLPKSTCVQRRSRYFHLDQETTAYILTSWYCQDLLVVKEDIEKYKIQIPTPMTLLWNAPSYFANPYVNSNPRCPSKGV